MDASSASRQRRRWCERPARALRRLRPRERGGQGLAAAHEIRTQPRLAEHAVDRGGDGVFVAGLDEQRAHAEDLAEGRPAAGDDRNPARHRLQHGQAEALVLREQDEHVRGRVTRGEAGVADVAGDVHQPRAAQRRHQRLQVERRMRAVVAHDLEGEIGPGAAEGRDGAQQDGQAAPVQDGPRGQDHGAARPQPRARLVARR